MSQIRADNITNRQGTGAPIFVNGIRVTGLTSVANIVAGTGTFTGAVSIGGTLTYEDVTNIDSVGLITARTGVKVLAGGIDVAGGGSNIVGVVTASTGIDAASNLILKTGGNEKVRVTSSGDVGIGVNDPDAKLEVLEDIFVKGSSGDGSTGIQIRSGSSALSNQHQIRTGGGTGNMLFVEAAGSTGIIASKTNGSERLRIGTAGQIGIGGANYGTDGQVLTSKGGSAAVQWATPAGGAWSVLTSQDIATNYGQTYWESKGWDVTNYSTYRYIFNQVAVNGGNFDLDIRFYYTPYSNGSASGAESLKSGGSDYNYYYDRRRLNGSGSGSDNQQQDAWRLGGAQSAETWNVDHTVALSPPTYSNIKSVYGKTFYYAGGQLWRTQDDCCLFWHQEGYITGVRVYYRGGGANLQHGRFQVLRMSKT